MFSKWPVAAVAAAVVLFIWGAVTHMAFNIENYVQPVPNEAAIVQAIQANVKEKGMYFFPNEMDPAKLEALTQTSPWGVLIYAPPGNPFVFTKSLALQFGTDLVWSLMAAFLFSLAAPSMPGMGKRVLFTALLGVTATAAVVAPYWNWYGFPAAAIVSSFIELGVGGALAGVVFAKLIK